MISNSLSLGTLQCRIIRTTELAAAREKLNELERRKDEILKKYAPASLVGQLHGKLVSLNLPIKLAEYWKQAYIASIISLNNF